MVIAATFILTILCTEFIKTYFLIITKPALAGFVNLIYIQFTNQNIPYFFIIAKLRLNFT